MRFRVNPFRSTGDDPPPDRTAIRRFHESLEGYRPTPLVRLPSLARATGIEALYVKDESSRFGLDAFKGLGAAWALHQLVQAGSGLKTVSSATDGNHGRAVAWTARRLGLEAMIFMTAHSAPARIEAIRREGATVVLVDGTYDDAVRICAERSAAHGWQVVADVGYPGYLEIPEWIADGYETLFAEITDQLEARQWPWPDVVVLQAGVGGFAAAGLRHFRPRARSPRIAVVEPVDADPLLTSALTDDGSPAVSGGSQHSIMACLNCGTVSLSAWPVLRAGVDVFFSISDDWAAEAMRRLGWGAGEDPRVTAGESGAAGLAGLLALMAVPELAGAREALGLGPSTTVLVVNTEGATDPESYHRIVGRAP
jgi:diaminopropionate ammonia-lyase